MLLIDLRPSYGTTPLDPVVGRVLVPLNSPSPIFGVLDAQGVLQIPFLPAAAIPLLIGQPLFFQGAMLQNNRVLTSSFEAVIFG